MAEFEVENVAVYALSYDEADALRDFRDAHNISYTLLSDPDSEVIRSFGILNTLIDENDHPWFGIPYPGAYVVDTTGEITHKFFDSNLAVRAGPEQLLGAVQGRVVTEVEPIASNEQEVQVSVRLDGECLTPTVQRDLIAQFVVPAGRHVYAAPAPKGSVAVDIQLEQDERLVQRSIIQPESHAHTLAGTSETFQVHHGVFELRLPITVNTSIDPEISITGQVIWQSCDDVVCDIPMRSSFQLNVPVTESPPVALGSKEGAALEPNAMAHFVKMSERRK